MAKALGTTPEEEYKLGLHKLAQVRRATCPLDHASLTARTLQQIKGQVGLFFTNSPPEEVIEWFDDFHPPDFARSGNRATQTFVLAAGPVMQQHSNPPEPFPHNEEPQLRKLGLHTKMVRGVPTLDVPHTVCEKGKVLTPEQTQLLKLVGVKLVEFRVGLRARWSSVNGEVTQLEGKELSEEEKENTADEEAHADDEHDDEMEE